MKPILFSTEMVQAILDGRKTQTRRVVKPQPLHCYYDGVWDCESVGHCHLCEPKPKYQVGDILYVRETWQHFCLRRDTMPNRFANHADYCFKASEENNSTFGCCGEGGCKKWKPSIFMPREAARIFLRVKSVRVERVQEISSWDAAEEGCPPCIGMSRCGGGCETCPAQNNLKWYQDLWDKLNAKRGYGWDTNPWVWVIKFERVEKP